MGTTGELKALIESVAAALGTTKTDHIKLSFSSLDGEWSWDCYVEAKIKAHGRGHRVVRSAIHGNGETPAAAVAEVLRKIAIPGYLDM